MLHKLFIQCCDDVCMCVCVCTLLNAMKSLNSHGALVISFTQSSYRAVPRVKQPGCEAEDTPPSSVEVKRRGDIPPLSNTSSCRA
jgi:hypothetical protein